MIPRPRPDANPNQVGAASRVNAGNSYGAIQAIRITQQKATAMNDATAAILLHDTCSPQELRRIMRSGRNSTYDAIASGAIPSFRIGQNIKIPTAWVRKQ